MTPDKESPEQMLTRVRDIHAAYKVQGVNRKMDDDMLRLINHLAAREKELEGVVDDFVEDFKDNYMVEGVIVDEPAEWLQLNAVRAEKALASRGWRGEVG